MIAIGKEQKPEVAENEWQAGFLAILPQIERHLACAFRRLDPEAREDAIQEGTVSCLKAYVRLFEQGRLEPWPDSPLGISDRAVRSAAASMFVIRSRAMRKSESGSMCSVSTAIAARAASGLRRLSRTVAPRFQTESPFASTYRNGSWASRLECARSPRIWPSALPRMKPPKSTISRPGASVKSAESYTALGWSFTARPQTSCWLPREGFTSRAPVTVLATNSVAKCLPGPKLEHPKEWRYQWNF